MGVSVRTIPPSCSSHNREAFTLVEYSLFLLIFSLFAGAIFVAGHIYAGIEDRHLMATLNKQPNDIEGWRVLPSQQDVDTSEKNVTRFYVRSDNDSKSMTIVYYPNRGEYKPIFELVKNMPLEASVDQPIKGTEMYTESIKGNRAVYYENKTPSLVRILDIFIGNMMILVQSESLQKEELLKSAESIDYNRLRALSDARVVPAFLQ